MIKHIRNRLVLGGTESSVGTVTRVQVNNIFIGSNFSILHHVIISG